MIFDYDFRTESDSFGACYPPSSLLPRDSCSRNNHFSCFSSTKGWIFLPLWGITSRSRLASSSSFGYEPQKVYGAERGRQLGQQTIMTSLANKPQSRPIKVSAFLLRLLHSSIVSLFACSSLANFHEANSSESNKINYMLGRNGGRRAVFWEINPV